MSRLKSVLIALTAFLVFYPAATPPKPLELLDPLGPNVIQYVDTSEYAKIEGNVFEHTWLGQPLHAQTGDFRGRSYTFTTQSAVGATTGRSLGGVAITHTTELIVTGAPATCTYRLQGSRDNSTWFNISAADITCTATTVAFVHGAPAQYVRGNLLTLTGGTAPTVTLKYIGR